MNELWVKFTSLQDQARLIDKYTEMTLHAVALKKVYLRMRLLLKIVIFHLLTFHPFLSLYVQV